MIYRCTQSSTDENNQGIRGGSKINVKHTRRSSVNINNVRIQKAVITETRRLTLNMKTETKQNWKTNKTGTKHKVREERISRETLNQEFEKLHEK